MSKWLPFPEKLPKKSGMYLIYLKRYFEPLKKYYCAESKLFYDKRLDAGTTIDNVPKAKPYNNVIAWTKLPELPVINKVTCFCCKGSGEVLKIKPMTGKSKVEEMENDE